MPVAATGVGTLMTTTTLLPTLSVTELRARLEDAQDRPHLLDVRTPGEFAAGHLPGAANVPLGQLAQHADQVRQHRDGEVVLVCASGARATRARAVLAGRGMRHTPVLEGGMESWVRAGGPVNTSPAGAWAIERQVRLVAGGIVLTSVLASTVVPQAKWLAGAIGGGLTFAAVSNTCLMARGLMALPWNKDSGPAVDAGLRRAAERATERGH
jgi:rhodanese-related sulfurtransferase